MWAEPSWKDFSVSWDYCSMMRVLKRPVQSCFLVRVKIHQEVADPLCFSIRRVLLVSPLNWNWSRKWMVQFSVMEHVFPLTFDIVDEPHSLSLAFFSWLVLASCSIFPSVVFRHLFLWLSFPFFFSRVSASSLWLVALINLVTIIIC